MNASGQTWKNHLGCAASLHMEPKTACFSLFAFVVCTFYLYCRFTERPSAALYLDYAGNTTSSQNTYRTPSDATPKNIAGGRSPVPKIPGNSAVSSHMEADMRRTMHSRLQRAKAYLTKVREEFEAARQYLTEPVQSGRFLTYHPPQGGLGNFMFIFATLVGSARISKRIAVLITKEPRMVLFEGMDIGFVDQSVLFPNQTTARCTVEEAGPGKFTPKFHNINMQFPDQAVALAGYGQSWKYFQNASGEVRAMFTFTRPIQVAAVEAILHGIRQLYNLMLFSNMSTIPLRVGIHVRRGDIVQSESQRRHGHVAASEEYLLQTVLHIQQKHHNVVFFVLSNDMDYCRDLFREKNFVFLTGYAAEVDMAVMTFMEVMILSVGSFGWWGAYLSDAREVHYYKDWPRPGSDFQKGVIPEDYFPPHWEGRS